MEAKPALATMALLLLFAGTSLAAAPGLDAYRNDKYSEAYQEFERTLKEHPNTHAADKIQFDAGAAAYKMGDYTKALEWFSKSLLSKDKTLQEKSHYNIGRTLEERADRAKTNENALGDLTNAQSHYEEALKIDPKDERTRANLEEVKRKIEQLKKKPPQEPSPPPESKKDQKQQKDQQKKDEQKQDQKDQKQQQDQSKEGDQRKSDKNEDQSKKEDSKAGPTASPSPGGGQQQQNQPSASPSASAGEGEGNDQQKEQASPSPSASASASGSPSPAGEGEPSPSPSPGSGEENSPHASPSPSAIASPAKKLSGDVKGAGEEKPNQPPQNAEAAPAEPEKEGQMSEKQAQLLLESMKSEEQRVQLDERKAARHVYKDW